MGVNNHIFWKVVWGLVAVSVGLCLYGIPSVLDVDSYSYQLMAEGRMSEVVRPYANRVLHPMVVRGMGDSFLVVAVLSLFVSLVALAGCFTDDKIRLDNKTFLCLIASPVLCIYIVNIYIQDLLVMALTALFFWSFLRERFWLVLVFLFLMQMARESTVVVAVALLAAIGLKRQWIRGLWIIVTMACAVFVVNFVSRHALDNVHSMNGLVYLVSKVLANGAVNLLGVTVWSDTYALQLPHYYPLPPLWQMEVPAWLPLGAMRVVGIYQVDFWQPVRMLLIMAGAFGVLPVLLFRCRRNLYRVVMEQHPAVIVAFLSGVVFFLLTPFSGRTVGRYVGYAWPLFWLALPAIYQAHKMKGFMFPERPWLGIAHLACMWWPVLLSRWALPSEYVCVLGIIGVVACLGYAWKYGARQALMVVRQ